MQKHLIIPLMLVGLLTNINAQEVFRTNLKGVAVQSFSSTDPIDGFTVSGPDAAGYVYLVAHAGSQSGQILRTKWQGTGVQEFSLPQGEYITGFEAESDLTYIYLIAVGSDGSRGDIVRIKWQGTAVQAYSVPAGQLIKTIFASGPDADGYVYLSVYSTGVEEPGEDWIEPPRFNLEEIAGLCSGNARIAYSLAKSCQVSICIYDATGRSIANLVDRKAEAGSHEVIWNGTDKNGRKVSAGIYFVKMDAGEFMATRKLIVVR
ncbi:MAG: FlgD immunoglobulin-like domain containing protein [candidate division WOR-3 bacterium]|nr:FlgD immunoglobulin-like domain containing protein [candidate division WOR-3 bacterium]